MTTVCTTATRWHTERQTLLVLFCWFMVCTAAGAGWNKGALALGENGESVPAEYCQWETFNATCPTDSVVLIRNAVYGRMRLGRCLVSEVSIGCGSNVLQEVDSRCSGRHQCRIALPDAVLHRQQQCPMDMGAYLEASYTCLKVSGTDPKKNPCDPNTDAELRGPSGTLANIITESTGRGSAACPWRIRVDKGQRVNITLLDFTAGANAAASNSGQKAGGGQYGSEREGAGGGGSYCQVYAIIKEAGNERETAVCGGSQRERAVYTSSGEAVDVAVTGISTQQQQVYFALNYQAVGCADMKPPANAWFSRDGDKAVVKCNFTGQTWHLVCKSTTWIGEMTNCTASSWANGQRAGRGLLPPYGLLVAVIIGVILGIVLGLCLLGVVLGCKRRRTFLYKQRRPSAGTPASVATPGLHPEQFYDSYDRATYKEQTCTLRRGEPGYTHVWELRSQKPPPPQEIDCAAAQKLSAYHDRAVHVRTAYPGLQQPAGHGGQKSPCRDHIYESPKFERRTLGRDPRSGETIRRDYTPFCSTFDPNAENARNMTLRSNANKCDDQEQTSDDTEDEIECDIHFPKKIGYRPIPRQGTDECRAVHVNM